MLSTQSTRLNYPVILSHQHSFLPPLIKICASVGHCDAFFPMGEEGGGIELTILQKFESQGGGPGGILKSERSKIV